MILKTFTVINDCQKRGCRIQYTPLISWHEITFFPTNKITERSI
jgi:hypothetical protein